jgi:beta-lactamase regulating signal transducer with metallopeptidase domain
MNLPLWFSNLLFWTGQIALVVVVAALLPRIFRIRQPRVLLVYWRALLALSLLLPFAQPWHRAQTAGAVLSVPNISGAASTTGPALTQRHFLDGQIVAEFCGFVIVAGIAVRFAGLGLGLLKLRRLRRSALPILPRSEFSAKLNEMLGRVGTQAEFRISGEVDSPVTFGLVAPVVLLPERFLSMGAGFQLAIACHELLHVRRRDWAHHLGEELLRAVLWFHPAILWLIGQVRLAREEVVDLAVVRITDARKTYIEALLEFAGGGGRFAGIPAPPFLRESQLTERVALMLKEVRMSRTRLIAALTAAGCGVVLAASVAVWAFPLKAAPHSGLGGENSGPAMNGESREQLPMQQTGHAGPKIVVADLKIDGDVKDVDAVRARILKSLEGREFDANSRWLEVITQVNIRGEFQSRGYFRVVASDPTAEPLDAERRRMRVLIHINEGQQYRTEDISIVGKESGPALAISAEELREQFHLHNGDLVNVEELRSGMERMHRLYAELGYVDVAVEPVFSIDEKNRSIAMIMRIDQEKQYRVGTIDVRGLDSATERVVKSKLRPGDIFNPALLEDAFAQGKAAVGTNVSFKDVVSTKRNQGAGTFDILMDFSGGATRAN